MNSKVILYPSNWLYNAGVIGFLKVLKEIKEENENIYKIEEAVEINLENLCADKIFEKWDEITYKKLGISYKGKSGGTKNFYYANQTERSIKKKIEMLLNPSSAVRRINVPCSFCGNISAKSLSNELIQTFGNILLGAQRTFPNIFWMLKSREFVCPKCAFIILCHHISFLKLDNNVEIFINAPNFRLVWDLNNFFSKVINGSGYRIEKILGISLFNWAIRRRALLGAWTIMNIEVIIKNWHKEEKKWIIDYFDLPYHITKILLDYEITNLINQIGEEKIFDLIINGKFSELEKANYYVLRAILKLKNNEEISDNDPITKYFTRYHNLSYLQRVAEILPKLYGKILDTLKQGG